LVLFALCTVLQESTHVQVQKFRNASQLTTRPDGATTQPDRINLFDLTDNLFLLAPFNAATVT
jgi:hypothetical protein